ncbi:ferritin family protein [Tissierella carlieri]|jgi:rubrerythrin|uniref:Ferritin family protein n=1 Tax=Tissierella carlieri TaxID=689904 RepID=A0ABT1SCN5_9FIRM|nr:ferritin family protein [Tissierella carlieri]MBU5310575.1 ferritin family protein [Tissierella carlieri]MCQ4924252.1 ferritin family protein [Tissierella carlieri]
MYKEELDIISQAILNEVEGYEFYRMAANQAGTSESEEAFLELANEELKHVEYLKALFNKIKDNKDDDIKLALEATPPSPDIYNWKKVDKEYNSLAMSVFGIGIQMEKSSIEFYEAAKSKTKFDEARKLFDLLIKWEKVHLEQFTEQYNKHKTDWWTNQGFAPF